jgi:hypothetical protein
MSSQDQSQSQSSNENTTYVCNVNTTPTNQTSYIPSASVFAERRKSQVELRRQQEENERSLVLQEQRTQLENEFNKALENPSQTTIDVTFSKPIQQEILNDLFDKGYSYSVKQYYDNVNDTQSYKLSCWVNSNSVLDRNTSFVRDQHLNLYRDLLRDLYRSRYYNYF